MFIRAMPQSLENVWHARDPYKFCESTIETARCQSSCGLSQSQVANPPKRELSMPSSSSPNWSHPPMSHSITWNFPQPGTTFRLGS